MSEDKSKLQLIGEILQADNKNLELIEELNEREDKIERLNNIIKEIREWILFQQEHSMEPYIATDTLDDILEILNKGE